MIRTPIRKGWITIGGEECVDGGGKHCGGAHVEVDAGGRIVSGPATLAGRKLSDLGKPKPSKPKKPDTPIKPWTAEGTARVGEGGPKVAEGKPVKPQAPKPKAAKAPDPAKVMRAYGDGVPPMPVGKKPLRLYTPEDEKLLGYPIMYGIASDEDTQAWHQDPFSTGRIKLDADRLRETLGQEGIEKLKERGWISESTLYGGGSPPRTEYALTRTAKAARAALLNGLDEVKVPETLHDVRRLGQRLANLPAALSEPILRHLGVDPDAVANQTTKELLEEMLYRRHNPVPVWERIKKDKVLQDKVRQIVAGGDEETELRRERVGVRRKLKRAEEEMNRYAEEADQINAKLFADPPPPPDEEAQLEERLELLTTRMERLGKQAEDLHRQNEALSKRQREGVLALVLQVDDPAEVSVGDFDPGHGPEERKAVEEAQSWLASKVARGKVAGAALPAYKVLNDDSPFYGRPGPSAYYQPGEHAINVPTGMRSVATNVHEMAHGIEDVLPGAKSAAQRFLRHRVKDEPLRKLKEVLPDHGYGDWEYGREDDFAKALGAANAWYAGKKELSNGCTEIVSMGVEQLYQDPAGFARADPEYCAFILGILDGRARDNPVE
jgi:hypothetical protein